MLLLFFIITPLADCKSVARSDCNACRLCASSAVSVPAFLAVVVASCNRQLDSYPATAKPSKSCVPIGILCNCAPIALIRAHQHTHAHIRVYIHIHSHRHPYTYMPTCIAVITYLFMCSCCVVSAPVPAVFFACPSAPSFEFRNLRKHEIV